MNKEKLKNFADQFAFHAGIAIRGLAKTVWGALVAGMVGIAVYGFSHIGSQSGYLAVGDFVTSCATLVVALLNIYQMGRKRKGGKK